MISKEEYRRALSRFASGVTVVTAKDQSGRRHGITVSAFCSVSLEPPLILVCLDKNTGSHFALTETDRFVVNILREDQQHFSDYFASRRDDKFDRFAYRENEHGIPVLKDVLVNLECRRVNAHDAGDHTIYIGAVERAIISDDDDNNPLLYWHGGYRKLPTA